MALPSVESTPSFLEEEEKTLRGNPEVEICSKTPSPLSWLEKDDELDHRKAMSDYSDEIERYFAATIKKRESSPLHNAHLENVEEEESAEGVVAAPHTLCVKDFFAFFRML